MKVSIIVTYDIHHTDITLDKSSMKGGILKLGGFQLILSFEPCTVNPMIVRELFCLLSDFCLRA